MRQNELFTLRLVHCSLFDSVLLMIRSLSTILLLLIPCFESFRFHSQELRRHHLLRLTPSEQYVKSPTHSSSSRLSMSALSTFASISTVASVIAFHEAGHLLAAKSQKMKVQSYNVGYGPKLFSFNDSTDTEYALRLIPLGGYVAFPSNVEYNEEGEVVQEFDDPDLLQNRPPLQRALVISAGVVANVLLTFLLSTGVAFTSGISHPTFNNGVIVTTNPDPSSPAFAAGITKGDLIVKLDNQVILGSDKAIENFVKKIGESADRTLTLQINRNDKIIDTSVVPHSSSSGGNKAKIGIGIANNLAEVGRVRAANILDASVQGAQETKRLIDATVAGIQRFFGDVQMDQMGGPISVIKAGAEVLFY